MADRFTDLRQELLAVVRSAGRRWRLRKLLGGLSVCVVSAVVLWLLAGWAIDASRFDSGVVVALRLLTYLVVAAALVRFVGRPLLQRVGDERAALYLEENEPSLGGRLISAVELGREVDAAGSAPAVSRSMLRHLAGSAVAACRRVDDGKRVERAGLRRAAALLAGSAAAGVALFLAGPGFLRSTLPLLLDPWREPAAHNPYRIRVEPGDVALAEGTDVEVTAWLEGFDAAEVELTVRSDEGAGERLSMLRQEPDGRATVHRLILFDLRRPAEYFVEASGVRSAVHRIDVTELPYVDEIHLTYHFPTYTGLDPLEQAGSGDIAAVVGTEVRLRLESTLPVNGGAIELEALTPSDAPPGDEAPAEEAESRTVPLTVGDDGTSLSGSLTVGEAAVYRIVLDAPASEQRVVASPDYLVDPLDDHPPTVALARPGRDIQVTALEEVVTDVRAQDDFGVSRVELVYSLNGGAEQTAILYRGRPGSREFAATHTLFMEELQLEPGDLVSYYARAFDAFDGDDLNKAVSDIYFLEIRPFDRNFRPAENSGAGAPGMSGEELTAQQRLILSATFKLARRSDARGEDLADDLATVALAQGRLRQDVTSLAERLNAGGLAPGLDSPLAVMAELLPRAAREMAQAEEALGEHRPEAALPAEQRALRLLQRAEAAFSDFQVSRGEGGGSGRGEISEELADLFEMERDRMRNRYEQVQRGDRESADDAFDETLEKLRELARRQQQENERMRARARLSSRQAGPGGSGGSQRQLAEEAEEAARTLERLAREESLPDLAETARELRRAVEEMRRAAAAGERAAEALGSSALDRLRQARRQLERDRSDRLERDTRRAIERSRRLGDQQQRMVERLDRIDPNEAGERRAPSSVIEAKERMAAEVGELEADLDQLARESQRDQPEAARRLRRATGEIRDRKIREKILYSRGVVQQRSRAYARNFEEDIAAALGELEERLIEAAGAIGETREQRLLRALEQIREATDALESLDGRLRSPVADPRTAADGTAEGGAGSRPRDATGQGRWAERRRQLRRELGQRRSQLEAVRDQLQAAGVDIADLDRVIDRLRAFGSGSLPGPESLAALDGEVVQNLKEFEYDLRRSLAADDDQRLLQVADDEVPDGYEEMVDSYYKALAGEDGRSTRQ